MRETLYTLRWGDTTFYGLSRLDLARNIVVCGFYYRLRYPSAYRD